MSIEFKDFVETVRSHSDIVDIIGADIDLRPAGSTLKGLSPFNPEKTPSLVVWTSTQSWHDFSGGGGRGGGRGGDVFSYVQERDKIGFAEAVFMLAERAGLRRPNQDEASWKRAVATAVERREIERLHTVAAAYYHSVLPAEIREESFKQHYGFTDETVDSLMLGWADGNLLEHMMAAGVSREMALKTGLFVVPSGDRVVDLFRNRLVFPYWRGGRVVYFIARRTEQTGDAKWEVAKYKKLLTHSEKHCYVSPTVRNDYWYNEDAVRGAEEILVTEGVTDCIAARQAGVACISPVTTRFRKQDAPRLIELTHRMRRVVICNDNEVNGAGEAGANDTAAALWAEKIEVCIAQIPRPQGVDKIDVNELVVAQGPDALRKVLADAKPYPEYLVGRVSKDAPKSELGQLLAPVLATLAGCSKLRADAVLDLVRDRFGVRRRALMDLMRGVSPKKGAKREATADSASCVPKIVVSGRQLRDIVADARVAVVQANERRIEVATASGFENDAAPLFVRGNGLVRLERPAKGTPQLTDLNEAAIFGRLTRAADWVNETETSICAVFPPKEVARDLLVYPPPGIPAVDSVITTPVFGRSGQLLVGQGLHVDDRLWLDADATLNIGTVPENPTPEQIAAARSLFMDDLFVDFPFAAQSDRAHAVALALLPFGRRMVDGCAPLHLVEAPAVGTGKGLLCDLVSIVATGEVCDCRTLPEDEDEIRKMLTAELAKALPLILLDNANEKLTLSAAPLCSVLTAEFHTDRLLGRSERLRLPNRAVWMLTGNNPKLSKDVARRSIRIRIDSKVDRAWLRTSFKHDPIKSWAKASRNELVHAALVLVQAWVAAGRPLSKQRLGSFEHWAGVMGGILEIAGIEGFLGNQNELYENADVEGQAWREFTNAWWEEYGADPAHVTDLVGMCEKHDLMVQVRGDGGARSQQSRLGRALQSARDRVFGEIQVVVAHLDRKKRTLYALKKSGDATAASNTTVPATLSATTSLGGIDPWQ